MTVGVSLRSAHVDLVDAARGDLTRSEWVRGVILRALAASPSSPSAPVPPAKAPGRRGRTATRRIIAEGRAERAAAQEPQREGDHPAGPPAVVRAAQEAERQRRDDGECGHGYPDVKHVAGVRVCRKCDEKGGGKG